ncbi:type II secretion system F family protein [Pseudomonas sp. R5(2019)]|uniref:type II secretion system F family protein n=1 Tax=Pseudomonas sp. R5(2019) TaxID=2697566 RepID=UPI00141232A9|nr:type II secretion system F family protein [Pseudomonas sp. R5(2019)]NBA95074.1 type II secretion system protein F [Pseudomonas sp. R5(2019)]
MVLMLSAVLFFSAFVLLLNQLARQRRRDQRVAERLQGRWVRSNRLEGWLQSLGRSSMAQRSLSLDNETQVLLNRIGWRKARQRALFAAFQLGTPLAALALVLALQGIFFDAQEHPWLAPLCALGVGYLLPKRVLALAAGYRQQQVATEVTTFISLLRILFESGLAVEQSLRILSSEGRRLLPVLSAELRLVLSRVDSGLELAAELEKSARLLAVDEFSDTCIILQQLIVQGGGAMKSLLALKLLLEDRRLTRLQEKISKLSGKMSIVMMLFLFPALLIVLAGPGFTALSRAFGP